MNRSLAAILSVYDKTGLVDLSRGLHEAGVHLLGSGGTAKTIREADIPIQLRFLKILYLNKVSADKLERYLILRKPQKC